MEAINKPIRGNAALFLDIANHIKALEYPLYSLGNPNSWIFKALAAAINAIAEKDDQDLIIWQKERKTEKPEEEKKRKEEDMIWLFNCVRHNAEEMITCQINFQKDIDGIDPHWEESFDTLADNATRDFFRSLNDLIIAILKNEILHHFEE